MALTMTEEQERDMRADGAMELRLSKGYYALVDADVYEWAKNYHWHTKLLGGRKLPYAARTLSGTSRSRSTVLLHREIMGVVDDRDAIVDHISGNTLDNRRSNLRSATKSQNCQNAVTRHDNTSGNKGVHWREDQQAWQAAINHERLRYHLGYYATKEEACAAYRAASLILHREFRRAQ